MTAAKDMTRVTPSKNGIFADPFPGVVERDVLFVSESVMFPVSITSEVEFPLLLVEFPLLLVEFPPFALVELRFPPRSSPVSTSPFPVATRSPLDLVPGAADLNNKPRVCSFRGMLLIALVAALMICVCDCCWQVIKAADPKIAVRMA